MSQPARFAQRSRILTDVTISASGCRLFLLLDDQAKGDDSIKIKQRRLAVLMGLGDWQLRQLLRELEAAGYLRTKRSMTGNVYDFDRRKTTDSDQWKTTDGTGEKPPMHPYSLQEILQEAKALRAENPTPDPGCSACEGRGFVRAIRRGILVAERCACMRERKSA